ncbi:MAG: TolC family protein [Bacteroidia bacterium]|nr:TolC family protein [Bacteroidia bacterium]
MKIFNILFITLILLISNNILQAQEKWSLELCINYALEHNSQIKQQELAAKLSKNTMTQSKIAFLPSVNGSVSQNFNFGRSIDPFTNVFVTENVKSNDFTIYASMPLFEGFQRINTMEKDRFNFLASLQDVDKMKNDISLNIAAGFLQILYNEELLLIAKNQQSLSDEQVERTKKLVDAGSLAKGNLLEMQAQESSDELQVVNSQNQLDISYLTLVQMLDLDSTVDFHIEHPDLSEISDNEKIRTSTSVYYEGVLFLPQIKSAEYRLKSSEKDLAVARGGYFPRLNLNYSYYTGYSSNRQKTIIDVSTTPSTLIGYTASGEAVNSIPMPSYDYSYQNYPFKDQLKDNAYRSLGLNLTIPIFNNWQVKTAVSNAKINVLNNQYQLETAKKTLFKEIQQAEADATAALKKYFASKKSVAALEESFKYSKEKFDVGMVTSVDFNTAKNNLAKAQSDLLQSKYEYIFKLNILEFYRGNPIRL